MDHAQFLNVYPVKNLSEKPLHKLKIASAQVYMASKGKKCTLFLLE